MKAAQERPSTFVEGKITHLFDDKRWALGYDEGSDERSSMGAEEDLPW